MPMKPSLILVHRPGREALTAEAAARRKGSTITESPIGTDIQEIEATESRGALLDKLVFAGGALAAGGVLAGGLAGAGAAASPALDRRILRYLLRLEELQESFYREARARAKLTGELAEFARVAGTDERAHVALLRKALGRRAGERAQYNFGRATSNARAFQRSALRLEELVTSAYIGQGANLSPRVVRTAARIASVEARHAAWLSAIAGKHPAPRAADHAVSTGRVQKTLRELGFVRKR
jgi:rubrerythrin